jgi:hypothetical protein
MQDLLRDLGWLPMVFGRDPSDRMLVYREHNIRPCKGSLKGVPRYGQVGDIRWRVRAVDFVPPAGSVVWLITFINMYFLAQVLRIRSDLRQYLFSSARQSVFRCRDRHVA